MFQPRSLLLLLVPALAVCLPARAQNAPASAAPPAAAPETNPAAAIAPAPTSAPQTPSKKVWTNEDLQALRSGTGVSVVGAAAAPRKVNNTAPAKPAGGKDANWYRTQLKTLYDKIPPIDAQIDQMHRFQDGSYQSPGGIVMGQSRPLNPADRIAALEKQKRGILDRIDALEDEARHAGILPGDLR